MEDEEILSLFEQRVEDSITQISKKYGKLCQKISYNILNNSEDVEECVLDSYLGAWNSIPPEIPKSLKNYLCLIVRNLSLKKYHYNTAQKRNSFYDIALDELSEVLSTNETPEDSLIIKEYQEQLNLFLSKLTLENRSIFILRYWYCESVGDIAKQFNSNENAISSRLKRIRKNLKEFFAKMED